MGQCQLRRVDASLPATDASGLQPGTIRTSEATQPLSWVAAGNGFNVRWCRGTRDARLDPSTLDSLVTPPLINLPKEDVSFPFRLT